ncbi:MAG: hypothetical protein RL722_1147 [Pseudomonadota bacterium]|jgi:crotonobetaine/carnitine-CoA ligase
MTPTQHLHTHDRFSPAEVLALYPWTDAAQALSLPGLLAARVAVAPGRAAIEAVDEDGRTEVWTYAHLACAAERLAALLAARGLQAGERLAVVSRNHVSTVVALLAVARLGAVLVPLNPDLLPAELGWVLGHCAPAGVLCEPELREKVAAALELASSEPGWLSPWLWLNQPQPLTALAGNDGLAAPPGVERVLPRRIEDAELTAECPAAPLPNGLAEATVVFIYTSGTTGFPKGVMHAQRTVVRAGEGFVARMHLQPHERMACLLPLFHINALFYSLAGALAAGATLLLLPRFSASGFWADMARLRATQVNTIAAVTGILMRRPRSEFVPSHGLLKVYGAPLNDETQRVFREEFGVPQLIEGYGMSEIPGALNNPYAGPQRPGSMGTPSTHPDPAIRLAELAIVDEAGQPLPDGQTGELVVRTPLLMQGYYRDPAQTAASLLPGGWFLTGDLARRDGEGYYWFVARKKDILRRRGENISGAEIDRVLESHPQVQQAAAIAVPAALGEDEILAAILPRPGLTAAEQAGLIPALAAWCEAHLAALKRPRYLVIVEALPQTPTHRVAKFRLRERSTELQAQAIDLSAIPAA